MKTPIWRNCPRCGRRVQLEIIEMPVFDSESDPYRKSVGKEVYYVYPHHDAASIDVIEGNKKFECYLSNGRCHDVSFEEKMMGEIAR